MRTPVRLWGLVAALSVVDCAVYTSSVRPDKAPQPTSAYLYGRFFMNADKPYGEIGNGKQSIGLVILCQDVSGSTTHYTFGSTDQRIVQVLEIDPARCWLMKAVLADQQGIIRKEIPTDESLQRPHDFTAGRAHYLGDYFAKGDYSTYLKDFATMRHWEWAMDPADDRYESTTAEMKHQYPKFASLPTDDMRLIAAPPRKRGNGIAASPGEPSMSPARLGGLAPFINRDYETPALCEAACPTGQCLPYRGPSRPMMACVIRCDRNADCPSGMACNCPNSEHPAGADCHPIASTPEDPMSRVCLAADSRAVGTPGN